MATAKEPLTNLVSREWNFDGCHFIMPDPYKGMIYTSSYTATLNPKAHHPFELEIQFDCEKKARLSELPDLAGVGKKDGKWIIAFDGDAKAVNTKLYTLQGKDWEGAGITQDQRDGDEERRSRFFTFCLVHPTQVLCGSSDNVGYLKYQNESPLPQVIKLLETIEFVETKSTSPSSVH